jgi:hypothetical protein
MARPLRIQYPDAYYHVMNRGNRGEAIFITDIENPFEAVIHQSVLGTEEFVAWVKKKLPQKGQREIPSLKKLHRHISVEHIIEQVAKAGNASGEDLRDRKTAHKVLRQMAMELFNRSE